MANLDESITLCNAIIVFSVALYSTKHSTIFKKHPTWTLLVFKRHDMSMQGPYRADYQKKFFYFLIIYLNINVYATHENPRKE